MPALVPALDLGGLGSVAALVFGAYAVVLWMALAYWALKDARGRSEDPTFHLFAMVINLLVPVLGLFVYLLVRPSLTLVDRQSLALEAEALSGSEEEIPYRPCPACGREVERDWVACPFCHTRFAKRCPSCRNAVRLGWSLCPFCAGSLEVGGVARAAGQRQ